MLRAPQKAQCWPRGSSSFEQKLLRPFSAYDLHLRAERNQSRRDSLIFLSNTLYCSRNCALAHEALQLFIRAQTKHLFPSAGSITRLKLEEDDVE